MSAAHQLPSQVATESLPRKRFTRTEFEHLIESGFFEGQRYELIDGDLVDKMGQNPLHAFVIRLVSRCCRKLVDPDLIQVQLPNEAGGEDRERSVPEPDIAILRELKDEYQYRRRRVGACD